MNNQHTLTPCMSQGVRWGSMVGATGEGKIASEGTEGTKC